MKRVKLSEMLDYIQPQPYIVSSENYSDEFKIPVLTAGKSFVLGKTNESAGIYDANKEKPIILFDDFTTTSKWVDFPFKVKSSACKILVSKGKANVKYAYYGMQWLSFDATQHKRYWISQYSLLTLPDYPETKKSEIVSNLDRINSEIDSKKKLLSELDSLVKSLFNEMFGHYFEDSRYFVKVGDIATATIGLTYKPDNVTDEGIIVLRSGNIQNAELCLSDDIVRVSNIKIKENKFVRENDILMCSRNGSARLVGKCCLIPKLNEQMSYGAFMTVIRSKYPYFLNGFFNSTYFLQQLTGTQTASVNQITTGMLNGYTVIKPSDTEENEFATFVKLIDKSKFVVQKEIKDLQELLDSKMDEYFGGDEE